MDKRDRFTGNEETNGDDLRDESYCQFELSLTTYGKFKKNFKIKAKVRHLKGDFRLNHDDILHELFEHYLSGEYHENYDPDKAKFSTFIVDYVNNNLNNLLLKAVRSKKREDSTFLDKDVYDLSDSFLKKHGTNETFETTTPEDYLIAKELLELIQGHYGIDNAAVLLGKKDRRSFAKEMGIDYYAYCKRLNRLTSAFKQVLADAGYC